LWACELDDKGGAKVSSSNYDEDLVRVMENRHSKIFMTMEAFERIRLRDDTINNYETYMRSVDSSFAEQESKKDDERAKGKAKGMLAILGDKSGSAPYLEDMGIDSLVVDEALFSRILHQPLTSRAANICRSALPASAALTHKRSLGLSGVIRRGAMALCCCQPHRSPTARLKSIP